jgi:hypothetical protein
MHERILKSVVVGMGLLIVLGVLGLGYGFYQKSRDPGWQLVKSAPEAATPSPVTAFGDIKLDIPAECVIARVEPDGERIHLIIGPPGPCNRIIVVDLTSGRVLGTIQAHP